VWIDRTVDREHCELANPAELVDLGDTSRFSVRVSVEISTGVEVPDLDVISDNEMKLHAGTWEHHVDTQLQTLQTPICARVPRPSCVAILRLSANNPDRDIVGVDLCCTCCIYCRAEETFKSSLGSSKLRRPPRPPHPHSHGTACDRSCSLRLVPRRVPLSSSLQQRPC
jgi:hypothetical protein